MAAGVAQAGRWEDDLGASYLKDVLRRLLGFLRPYRKGVVWSLLLALLAMLATVAIPYLSGRGLDAIRTHDRHQLVLLGFAVAAAGLVRLGLTVARRLVAGKVSLGVEYDLRTGSSVTSRRSSSASSTTTRPAS